jgi:SAM-dependent methyltransferase
MPNPEVTDAGAVEEPEQGVPGMEFTGERLVPGAGGLEDLYAEHMSRYLFAAALAPERRVLDAGCGCGYGTHLMALAGAAEALGVDISPEAVEFAGRRYRHSALTYRVMDCRELELDGRYGLVTCFELIEHVKEDAAVVGSLAGVLDEHGVCLVSTPNASTYVAGGEGGDNPYHCREYSESEFEDLLKSAFGSVTMLEQRWIDGMLISPPAACTEPRIAAGASALIPDDRGTAPVPAAYGPARYFLAACSRRPEPALIELAKAPFVACTEDSRYSRLKEEFDRRGQWARRLDGELRERDALISRLRDEKEKLEKEFDERGLWARGLDRQLREKDEVINKIAAENEQLRRAALMAGR